MRACVRAAYVRAYVRRRDAGDLYRNLLLLRPITLSEFWKTAFFSCDARSVLLPISFSLISSDPDLTRLDPK